jgi:transposase InsO family protein
VNTAKGKLQGVGIGSVEITVIDGGGAHLSVKLTNVLHVPNMDSNLLSTNVLLANGIEINMHPTRGTKIIKDGRVLATTVPHGKLSRLRTVGVDDGANALKMTGPRPNEPPEPQELPYDVWHRRLAHLSPWNLKKAQQMATGIAIDATTFPTSEERCEACIQGGQTRHLSDKPMRRRTVPGDLIHSDICGWITPNSLGDGRYFLTFIDDATRMTYLYVLKSKTALEVRDCFLHFRNTFEQDGRRIKSIRTDGGGEYRKQMAELCKELGINHEETAPYTPEQNGVAERANRVICERIRSIIAETGLPKALWAEIARTVAHLKNRSPTRSLKAKTPYEALYGKKPDLSHIVAVGTKAMPHIPKGKTKKIDSRAGEGIMVGYGGSNQYRIWDPADNKIIVSRDVDFIDEAKGPAKPKKSTSQPERIVYDMIEVLPEPKIAPGESESKDSDDEENEEALNDNDESATNTTGPREASFEPKNIELSPEPRVESVDQILPPRRRQPPRRYDEEYASHVAFLSTSMWSKSMEPRNYQEAINHPLYAKEWELAIKEEYESLMRNGAWELVEPPPGRNIVTCKWVFKAKRDANGSIVRFKARLVARGFTQAYGVDYLETYAPVTKLTTYRVIFALAALEQWEIHGMDVITAFLLGKLDEDIYMTQPEGFVAKGMKKELVCKLMRSLYGLKQASRVWNLQLHEYLVKIGFERSSADTCLYVNHQIGVIIAIWVDDLVIAGKDSRNIAKVKKQLAGAFKMKDLGELTHFLGMRVTKTSNGSITIDQRTYVWDILARFGMEDSKAVSTPLATGTRLTKSEDNSVNDIQPMYQAMVGSLMYAMLCTRPDIAYAVQQLSQFSSKPTNAHFQAAKRVLRYLQGTQGTSLTYKPSGNTKTAIQGYCDANFAADDDRKSISGYVFMLAGAPISWQAKKQSTIALSTVEAEYTAMTQAVKEAIWLQNLLKDLGMSKYAPKILKCDNQGAISLANNPTHHARTKHVDIQLHFVRDHVERCTIKLIYCPTEDMAADLMTKGLPRDRHGGLMKLMGMTTTTPSPVEVNCPIRKVIRSKAGGLEDQSGFNGSHSTETTSGSVELRGSCTVPAGNYVASGRHVTKGDVAKG